MHLSLSHFVCQYVCMHIRVCVLKDLFGIVSGSQYINSPEAKLASISLYIRMYVVCT